MNAYQVKVYKLDQSGGWHFLRVIDDSEGDLEGACAMANGYNEGAIRDFHARTIAVAEPVGKTLAEKLDELDPERRGQIQERARQISDEDPRLPKFYKETYCSQCGKTKEWLEAHGCPESRGGCGRRSIQEGVTDGRNRRRADPRKPDEAFAGRD